MNKGFVNYLVINYYFIIINIIIIKIDIKYSLIMKLVNWIRIKIPTKQIISLKIKFIKITIQLQIPTIKIVN